MFPCITYNDITITGKKGLVKGDALFDDGLHNLIGNPFKKFVFDRPWNRNVNDEELGLVRVYNFDDVRREVYKLHQQSA